MMLKMIINIVIIILIKLMTETPSLTVSSVIELLSQKHLVELHKVLKTKNLDVYPVGYKSTEERLTELESKYFDLVWFARRTPEDYDNIPGVKEPWDKVVSRYPKEVNDLSDPNIGDWSHGFNSGMLACVRLLRPYLKDVDWSEEIPGNQDTFILTRELLLKESEDEFPFLDT